MITNIIGKNNIKYKIFIEFKKNFKLSCDKIIIEMPIKKIFSL